MADKKITALTATTGVVAADVLPIVTDTTGTPTTKKITAANLAAYTSTGLATLASPTFTGVPAAPTAAISTSTTQVATTAYVMGAKEDDQFILSMAVFNS